MRLELASLYFGRGQYRDRARRGQAGDPGQPEHGAAYNLRGLIYAALGNMAQADESFQRALQINPRDADTMHNYGWLLCQNQRFAEADAQFQQALAQPKYRDAARTLLRAWACARRATTGWPMPSASLMRSYELDPSSAETAFNLADVLYRRGELRARALLHRPRQQVGRSVQRADAVAGRAHRDTSWATAPLAHGLGDQLRKRFPQSPEALAFEQGRFDD